MKVMILGAGGGIGLALLEAYARGTGNNENLCDAPSPGQ